MPITGYLALQLWLLNLLVVTVGKFSSKPFWIESIILIIIPTIAGLASGIATAFEKSFTRGLIDTNNRGIEIEKVFQEKGIFTRTNEIYTLNHSKGESITASMEKAYDYIIRFWVYYLPLVIIYVINSLS